LVSNKTYILKPLHKFLEKLEIYEEVFL
jgi:hypothetical protein